MRYSLYAWGETLVELAQVAQQAEACGIERVWTAELARSPFIPAAAMAAATTRIGVGTGIALAFVRSPMSTALEALDLDEVSNGRFVLGLGAGVRRLNEDWHNVRFGQPVAHLRETIEIIRAVWDRGPNDQPIEVDGTEARIRVTGWERPFPSVRPRVPIYVAAVGPAMTKLAGRVADGWLAHELGSPRYFVEHIQPSITAGLQAAGRDRKEIDLVASACCVPHHDAKQAKRWAAGLVAFYATVRTYTGFFAAHGFGTEAGAVQAAFRSGDREAMIDAVPDAMVDALTFAGTPGEIRDRLRAYEGLVDQIKLSPPTHHVTSDVTRLVQSNILELVSSLA